MIYIDLIHNISLLVAISIVSGFVDSRKEILGMKKNVIQGILFGTVAVIGMMKPMVLGEGLIFDGRSVVISLCGFFFGPIAVVTAAVMASLCRIIQGGVGALTGVLVIISSSLIGVGFYFRKLKNQEITSTGKLFLFGILVHSAMLLLMLTLPLDSAIKVLKNISLPVMIIYPLATILIGKILTDQDARNKFIETIKYSESRYRQIIETANEGIWILDKDFKVSYANKRMCDLLGFTQDEMFGQAPDSFLPDEDKIDHYEKKKARAKGEFSTYERKFLKKNGELLWTIVSASPMFDENKSFSGSFAMFTDITKRKEAENALEKERNLFIGGPSMVFIWKNEKDWPVEYVSKNIMNHLGYAPEDFTSGRFKFENFVHFDDWSEIIKDGHRKVFTEGASNYTQEYRLRSSDGDYLWVHDFTMVVRDHHGEISHFHGYLTNITDRKNVEEALRESEGRLRAIIDNSPVGIALSRDGICLDTNPVYLKMFGYESIDEIRGSSLLNQIAPKERDRIREIVRKRSVKADVESLYESIGLKKDGIEFPFMVSTNRIELNDGALSISFFTDLTQQKKVEKDRLDMERKLLHTQKLESLGVLAGGIAHDFNNLLMAVLGHADLALSEISPASPIKPQLEEIITASRRAADLCRQMLAYSGKGRFVIERIVLRDVIDEMLHLLKTCISKNAILNLNLSKNIPQIECDQSQIRQLLMNLVINASEAIGERSGVITISTGAKFCDRAYLFETFIDEDLQEGLYVSLEVSDTGCGMSRETQERLFEPFYTTKFTGRGLGMSAVLGIVRGHKGAIRVYSEPGQGTTFRVLFPALDILDEEKTYQPKPGGDLLKGAGRVLLVDDEDTVLVVAGKILERFGYKVVTAHDGCEALEVYSEYRGDFVFVLIDLTMPRMNGEEAFRELRRLNPDLPVIISSGYTEHEIAPRFAGKRLAGFIQKPYRMTALQEVIKKALE